jgi:glucokinase
MGSTRTIAAVDIGGTKVAAALVRAPVEGDESRGPGVHRRPDVVARSTRPTDVASAAACLNGISACIDDVTRVAERLDGIGIGIASRVDYAGGRVAHSTHLPLTDVPVRALLERRHGVPVAVDNDATAACIGEHVYGAGADCREMLMLTLGTGIGGGIICGGRPYRGFGGSAGEFGHVMIDMDGLECPGNCPNHGCLEAYASGTAMGAAARASAEAHPESALGRALRGGEVVDGLLLTRLAAEGDGDAVALLARVGEYLGAGLVSLVNIFNPEVIVVGGGAAAAGDLLLGPARRVVARRALPPARDQVRVLPAVLGPEAGIFGAAALILARLEEASPDVGTGSFTIDLS